jgi:hypothetical protein
VDEAEVRPTRRAGLVDVRGVRRSLIGQSVLVAAVCLVVDSLDFRASRATNGSRRWSGIRANWIPGVLT